VEEAEAPGIGHAGSEESHECGYDDDLAAGWPVKSLEVTRRACDPGPHLPSVEALESPDEELLARDLWILATRRQIAVVRAIADALERLLAPGSSDSANMAQGRAVQAQLLDEMSRLWPQASTATRPANDDGHTDERLCGRIGKNERD
jgi:hypothetical protein